MILFKLTNKNKINCPQCNKRKHFCRYIYVPTGEYLPQEYGRCDNEVKCGYHKKPDEKIKNYYKENYENQSKKPKKTIKNHTTMQYFDKKVYEACQNEQNYEANVFLQNLIKNVPYPFPKEKVYEVARMYRIGTVVKGDFAGACAFPFIDIHSNINAVQIKKFNKDNHTTDTNFLHKNLEKWYKVVGKPVPEWLCNYLKNESYVNCLFGEHLLSLSENKNKPVCVVEAPKTAIYCTLYFGSEKALWLSCYSLTGLTLERTKILTGRKVFLFPDMSKDGSAYEKWRAQASYLESVMPGTTFKVVDLLEKIGTTEQKEKGYDIADLLITQNWQNFAKKKPAQPPKENPFGASNEQYSSAPQLSDEEVQLNKKQNEKVEELKKRLEKTQIQSVVGFMNNSNYVQDDSLPTAEYTISLYDMHDEFLKYCEENGKKPCDINEFAEILQSQLKIEIQVLVKLKKLPF